MQEKRYDGELIFKFSDAGLEEVVFTSPSIYISARRYPQRASNDDVPLEIYAYYNGHVYYKDEKSDLGLKLKIYPFNDDTLKSEEINDDTLKSEEIFESEIFKSTLDFITYIIIFYNFYNK